MRRGALSRAFDHARKADLKRQRALEDAARDEHERVPRGRLADRKDDEHVELPDEVPPGYARSDRW